MCGWYIYLIRTRCGCLYTGIATDVLRRFAEHAESGEKAAKYLRSKGPLELVYYAGVGSHVLASKAEYRIKRLSKKAKEEIVAQRPDGDDLLKKLAIQAE
ncbi:MAG: GIY-YIG nuclease family protein [Deltaproteobacteria bacterium]|nr:GIY-YIG nuclease family protein [Deltaproteobacteria bacterium]